MNHSLKLEKRLWRKGFKYTAGLDESGRGSLAGPIVAAAVIFKKLRVMSDELREINDSKLLSPQKREKLFQLIKKNALAWSIARISAKMIDKKGISWANLEVMKRAIKNLKIKPDYLIVDGKLNLDQLKIPYSSIIDGDRKIFSCGAASILAKETRDRIMKKLDTRFPNYEFAKHKGYGTKRHYQKLKRYGPCSCHRRSFRLQ